LFSKKPEAPAPFSADTNKKEEKNNQSPGLFTSQQASLFANVPEKKLSTPPGSDLAQSLSEKVS
jgi:hypothetical protein